MFAFFLNQVYLAVPHEERGPCFHDGGDPTSLAYTNEERGVHRLSLVLKSLEQEENIRKINPGAGFATLS